MGCSADPRAVADEVSLFGNHTNTHTHIPKRMHVTLWPEFMTFH